MYFNVPIRTITLGNALQNIISFQFPDVNVSKNIYAKNIPNIFPKDIQKLSKSNPFPLYFIGDDYAYIEVVSATVNPKLNP